MRREELAAFLALNRRALRVLAALDKEIRTGGGRPVDPLQDELEIEGQLEFADHDDREIVALQRDQIAVSNLAPDDKAEPFEEDLDRPIKGHLQNRSHV